MKNHFDELAMALAQGLTRRGALRCIGGGLAGALLASCGLGKAWAGSVQMYIKQGGNVVTSVIAGQPFQVIATGAVLKNKTDKLQVAAFQTADCGLQFIIPGVFHVLGTRVSCAGAGANFTCVWDFIGLTKPPETWCISLVIGDKSGMSILDIINNLQVV
jgi:hypothetical protein